MPGQSLGSDSLLGVVSGLLHATSAVHDGTDWLGSPGFLLHNRENAASFDASVTYQPSLYLYLQRSLIDGLRVVLPGYVVGAIGILSLLVVLSVYDLYGVWGAYTAVPLLASDQPRLEIIHGTVGFGSRLKFHDDNFIFRADMDIQTLKLNNRGGFVDDQGLLVSNGIFHNYILGLTLARNSINDPIFPKISSPVSLKMLATPPFSLF